MTSLIIDEPYFPSPLKYAKRRKLSGNIFCQGKVVTKKEVLNKGPQTWNVLDSWKPGWVLDSIAIDEHRVVIIEYEKTVKMFDSYKRSWTKLPRLPRDLEGELSSVLFQGFLYILVVDELLSSIWRLNVETLDEWEEITQKYSQRTGCASVAGDQNLYVSGGQYLEDPYFRSQETLGNFVRYNSISNTWTNLPCMKYERRDHETARVKENIYILGGKSIEHGKPLTSMEVFHTRTQVWKTAPKMPITFLKLSSVVLRSRWIVVVGTRLDGMSHCIIYDTRINVWFNAIEFVLNLSIPRVLLQGEKQIVIVGQNDDEHFSLKAIDFHSLHPWFSIGHMITIRRLIDTDRATVNKTIGKRDERIIQKLVTDTNDDVYRRVLSFLISNPKVSLV